MENDSLCGADVLQIEDDAIAAIRKRIDSVSDSISIFEIKRGGNGMIVLTVHGIRNHRNEQVIDLLRWSSAEFPASFGLLHVWDDEHPEYDNCFRVYRYAHGVCSEMDDPHLSPCLPTIETTYKNQA